jgi:F-type H+-transporting ATPase subunit b
MPQFEVSTALSQVFWLAIIFALLFLALSALLPKLQRVVDQRERLVADDLAAAERLKTEAEATHGVYEAGLNEARARALKLTTEVKEQAARETAERIRIVDEQLEVRTAEATARIDQARRQAAAEMGLVVEQATSDIVERLLGRRPEPARVQAVLSGLNTSSAGDAHAAV